MGKRPPYKPPVSNIRMGRPPIRSDERLLEELIAVRLRPEEDAYLTEFCALIQRHQRNRTAIMRDLLELGLGVFDDATVGEYSVQTCAKGKRYVFRVTGPRNKEVDALAKRITSELGSRVFMIDVATRLVLMAAKHTLEGLFESGKIDALPECPLDLKDPREFNFKPKETGDEGDTAPSS